MNSILSSPSSSPSKNNAAAAAQGAEEHRGRHDAGIVVAGWRFGWLGSPIRADGGTGDQLAQLVDCERGAAGPCACPTTGPLARAGARGRLTREDEFVYVLWTFDTTLLLWNGTWMELERPSAGPSGPLRASGSANSKSARIGTIISPVKCPCELCLGPKARDWFTQLALSQVAQVNGSISKVGSACICHCIDLYSTYFLHMFFLISLYITGYVLYMLCIFIHIFCIFSAYKCI